MSKEWKDMNKEERASHLFNKMKNSINETSELIGLNLDSKKASLYAKVILKANAKINLDRMQDYVISKYNGFNYPPVKLFLDSLGIVSESEKLATQAENAWSNLLPRLPYMKETTSYNSTDASLIYALDRITIKRVVQSQKCTDSMTNVIDGYLLSGLKKDFIRFYNEAQKNGSDIMQIEGTGSVKVEIEAERKPKVLLGGSNRPQLKVSILIGKI